MKIGGMVRSTLLDYPKKISCVLFASGCSYDCFYCHNRTLVQRREKLIDQKEIEQFLLRRKGLLEAVVISGGEPTVQPDLAETCAWIKKTGYAVKLDTNGCSPSVVERLVSDGLVDYVALDVKAPWARYREICGPLADPGPVRQTLGILSGTAIGWETRTTVCPTLGREDLEEIGRQMPPVPLWRLNRYRIPPVFEPEDRGRIHGSAPDAAAVQGWEERLRLLQPNLVTFSA
jgi:pyruvate formate lyase activating enzyme